MLMQLNNPQKTGAWQIIKKDIDTLQYNFLSMQYRKIQSYEKPDKGSETCIKLIGIGRSQFLLTVNVDSDDKFDQLSIIMDMKIRII